MKPLVDPSIVAQADGIVRVDKADPQLRYAFLPIVFPSSHASNLMQLRNGDLLCVWFSGSWEGESGVAIVLSRLDHGSKRWSKPIIIDHHDGQSYQNPMLFEAPDGVLHLYHTTQPSNGGENQARVLEVLSHDGGHTWSQPRQLLERAGAFTRHPMVVLPDGRWLLPLTVMTSEGIGSGADTNYSVMDISADHGSTWTECAVPHSEALVQPTLVEVVPHKWISLFRDRRSMWMYRSESSDGCKWSEPTKIALPNNNASTQMIRLKDGHLALVFDNTSKTFGEPASQARKPLSIAISTDNGETWSAVRDIETGRIGYGSLESKPHIPGREEYSYPSVFQTRDGRIHVSFTFRRQTIKDVSFPESWVAAGSTQGQYRPSR
ncbi:Predicted neuraminidase (sialidase) [Bryocella elongata]|uniref:Predicted neuraminidase (Sialidase) n=2 Tax=Bryocella elongata TaxID=863522 RepID=A0A1H5VZ22_9BACT|nr:Predicted neuraminidase (sialidase) [Bryocella elongata]